jgi:class 3 adenylate cyclase
MRGYMDELTKVIFDEQGMVVEFTGDGVFAAFGVPTSHEDHIAASIRAALVAKRIVPDSRLGLDSGACLFGPMGARLHAKLGLFGTVVNRASRLEQLARPERMEAGILCTRAIAANAGAQDAAQFLRVGMVVPKGLQDAVEVFEAVPRGTLPDDKANALAALSTQLEEARDTMSLLAVAHSAQQLAGVHRRFAWLARTTTSMLQNPGAWDGMHRPAK